MQKAWIPCSSLQIAEFLLHCILCQTDAKTFIKMGIEPSSCFLSNVLSKIALAFHHCRHYYITTCILLFQKGKCLWSTHLIFSFATVYTQLKKEMKVRLKEGGLCEFHFDSAVETVCACLFFWLQTGPSFLICNDKIHKA